MTRKISVGSWAYIWGGYTEKPIPLPVVVEHLKALHFDGIEFAAYPPHLESNTRAQWKLIKRMFDDAGLGISGIGAPFISPSTSGRQRYLDVLKGHLDMCDEMGSAVLRVDTVDPPTRLPGGMDYDSCFSTVAAIWHDAAEISAQRGVKLVWEFEPGFIFNKPSEVVNMVYKVDHHNFSIMFDCCHAHMCAVVGARQMGKKETLPGGVVQFAHMLTGKIGAAHFIDSDGTLHDNNTSTHAPFGKGVIDFDALVPAMLEAGFSGEWWPIDLCYWPNALEVTSSAKAFMDGLLARHVPE
jgi:sugar phosphate isomerase/epimerase